MVNEFPNGTRDSTLVLDVWNKPSEFVLDFNRVALCGLLGRAHPQSDLLLSMSSKSGMLPGPPGYPLFWPIS